MSCRPSVSQHGFTLVELSIVIVIIGLLVGGILVGRDMIHAAEIRQTISQQERYNTAVNTFRDKYNCLPGDCPNASNFGFDPTSNGNGDGSIGLCNSNAACKWSVPNATQLQHEFTDFWYQLGVAGLIAETFQPYSIAASSVPGVDTPGIKIASLAGGSSGGWCVVGEAPFNAAAGGGGYQAHSLILADNEGLTTLGNVGAFHPIDMYAIDKKIDDGLPMSGKARAFGIIQTFFVTTRTYEFNFSGGIGAGGPNNAVCVRNDTAPFQYNVQYTDSAMTGLCGLVIKGTF